MTCCIPDCYEQKKNRKYHGPSDISYHELPSKQPLRNKWIELIQSLYKQKMPWIEEPWQPKEKSIVCSRHFVRSNFSENATHRKWLKPDAIPTRFEPKKNLKRKRFEQNKTLPLDGNAEDRDMSSKLAKLEFNLKDKKYMNQILEMIENEVDKSLEVAKKNSIVLRKDIMKPVFPVVSEDKPSAHTVDETLYSDLESDARTEISYVTDQATDDEGDCGGSIDTACITCTACENKDLKISRLLTKIVKLKQKNERLSDELRKCKNKRDKGCAIENVLVEPDFETDVAVDDIGVGQNYYHAGRNDDWTEICIGVESKNKIVETSETFLNNRTKATQSNDLIPSKATQSNDSIISKAIPSNDLVNLNRTSKSNELVNIDLKNKKKITLMSCTRDQNFTDNTTINETEEYDDFETDVGIDDLGMGEKYYDIGRNEEWTDMEVSNVCIELRDDNNRESSSAASTSDQSKLIKHNENLINIGLDKKTITLISCKR